MRENRREPLLNACKSDKIQPRYREYERALFDRYPRG